MTKSNPMHKNDGGVQFPEKGKVTPGISEYPNPGIVENLHLLALKVKPIFFDGIELNVLSNLEPNKTLSANWVISNIRPSGFRIGGIWSWRCNNNIMETPTIRADINPSTFSTNFGIVYYPSTSFRIEGIFQRAGNLLLHSIGMEYTRLSSTITAKFYNTTKNSGRFAFSVLKSFTDCLALGNEVLFEWDRDKFMADIALAIRYKRDNYCMAATVSDLGFDISYWHQLHETVQMGSLLVFNKNTRKAIATICYQTQFDSSTIRGMIDSDWSVGIMYSRNIEQVPCGFGLSILYSIAKNRFGLGCKFDIEPSKRCN